MTAKESEIQSLLAAACPLYEHIGLVVESARDGVYRCRVPLDAKSKNHIDTVHAAIQWAAAEVLGALVVIETMGSENFANIYGAVKSASIEFLRPARTDVIAEALFAPDESDRIRALIDAGREATFSLDAALRSAGGEVVATLKADYVLRPRRRAGRGLFP